MNVNEWQLHYSIDGWKIIILEGDDAWKYAVEEAWDSLCNLTWGWTGGHGLPSWVPDYVVGRLMDLENRMFSISKPKHLHTIDIDVDVARVLAPEFVEMMDGDDDD